MARFDFLVETFRTERLKTLSLWGQVPDEQMRFRPEVRARSPLEHMLHQCYSEHAWMEGMLGVAIGRPAIPAEETRRALMDHYGVCSMERLAVISGQPDEWFEGTAQFFNVVRTRAWVLTRRFTHSAHHRGQLTTYFRLWGLPLYSTYGPTADTGGLPKNGAVVIYAPFEDEKPPLPPPSKLPVTERGDEKM